ncbi:hypothetical protein D9M72_371920 [compost metagenome]
MVSLSYSLARLTICCVICAISSMNSSRFRRPRSICESLCSHSPVSSACVSSCTPRPRSSVISWNALAVGISSRPSRTRYFSVSRPSMMAARVAGVPRPLPAMASRSASSSTSLPAPSMADSSVASL